MGQTEVADLMGAYLNHDPEVFEPNAATMLIRRAIGEGWDGKIFLVKYKQILIVHIRPGFQLNFKGTMN